MTHSEYLSASTSGLDDNICSALANFRDLGGLRVASGTIKPHLLFRSDDLSLSPSEELHGLVDSGLRTVLDLRSPAEQYLRPHLRLGAFGIAHHSLSFINDAIDPQTAAERLTEIVSPHDLGCWYAQMAEAAAGTIVHGLEIVSTTQGSVLFHCAAGKDRAGIFSAAVLSVLGAEIDTIVEDYARTDLVIGNVLSRLANAFRDDSNETHSQWNPEIFQRESPLLRAHADSARSMLDELISRHGGMLELLRKAGLTTEIQEALTLKLVS